MRKKSYMNIKTLLNEGIFSKIFQLIKRGKINRLRKKFKKHPEVMKQILAVKKWEKSLDKRLRSQGINPDDWMDHL